MWNGYGIQDHGQRFNLYVLPYIPMNIQEVNQAMQSNTSNIHPDMCFQILLEKENELGAIVRLFFVPENPMEYNWKCDINHEFYF